MIPYLAFDTIQFGPITIHVWGFMVALGFLTSTMIARAWLKRRGYDSERLTGLAAVVLIGSIVGARVGHAAFYNPAPFLADPWEIFRIWHGGLSSYGGFLGGAVAALWYFRRHRLPIAPYAAAAVHTFPWGWAIGRVGCFLIHDHSGTLTNSIFGVRYPDGVRHDLGFIEILNALGMGAVILVVRRLTKRDGAAAVAGVAWYAIVRFLTDFLRATDLPGSDARFFGLTPAQYGSLILLVVLARIATGMLLRQKSDLITVNLLATNKS